jgi:glycerophosphoryl diester phosphodiesterase
MAAVKPRLADLLDSVKQYMMMARRPFPYFNIETKSLPEGDDVYHPKPDKFVELLMQVIRDKQLEDFVIIQSFDPRTLQYLHQKYPAIRTALLMEAEDKRSLKAQLNDLGFTPAVYSPAWERVNEALVKDCHRRGMKIIPWTVNEAGKIRELKSLGVDGIITDYPDLFE